MAKRCIILLLLSLGLVNARAEDAVAVRPLTNCLAITEALLTTPASPIPFDVRATVTDVETLSWFSVTVQDETGATRIYSTSIPLPKGLKPGMRIHAKGEIIIYTDRRTVTECKTFDILGTGNPPLPTALTVHEAHDLRNDARLVRLTGNVQDLWVDDTNPQFIFFVLSDSTDSIFVSFHRDDDTPIPALLIGADVSVTGIIRKRGHHTKRPYMCAELCTHDRVITVIRAADDPFSHMALENLTAFRPHPARTYAHCRMHGKVLAAWNGNQILLCTDRDEKVLVNAITKELPSVNDRIDVVGIPVVNLYRAGLVRAIWRPAASDTTETPDEPARDIPLTDILTDAKNRRRFNMGLHGTTLRVTGEVRNYDPTGRTSEPILIGQDGLLLPVHAGNGVVLPPDLAVGSVVSATGVCVIETESWGDNSLFPAIRSCSLVLRDNDALKILKNPPWWTPDRVKILVTALLGCIVLAAVWIILLRRLAEQRGRILAKESVAHAESALKVYERSRLAVELHDTISQNLTGAVWQIRSAMPFYRKADNQPHHLDIALKTIDSCRGELRNCIWDLRNNALEKAEVDEAIRLTLRPIVKESALSVRFNIPRDRLTDSTLHTILSVIREFASNGVRHGKATEIKVAGAIEGDKLLFSVRDNGCGFAPSEAPGMDDGHFGLQGVRERLRPLGGTLTVDSQPGRGCKCTVSTNLPQPSHS